MSPDKLDRKPVVLIVDDEPLNLKILAELLKDGFVTRAAKSGEQALRRVADDPRPDLILLDVMMPEMDGHEVCRRLKADPETADIPIIFITAMEQPKDEARGLALGAADYITKPIDPDITLARIQTHAELSIARQTLAEQNEILREAILAREEMERISRHDLKSPLTAIVGFPQLLLHDDNITESQKELLNTIIEAGRRMLDMINMSLNMVKMEKGTYALTPTPVSLTDMALVVVNDLQSLASAHQVTLDVAEPGQTIEATGDPLLATSMISNLLKNAIEASPPKETVAVGFGRNAETARITIRNKGEVPTEMRERFFDKYSTSGKSEGTGLGTYSARLMAETQNGKIVLDCNIPGETTVIVHLPRDVD